ncbi:MAG TPA: ThuA domain-containing protein [Erysipelothrix sp.]|nr:ThuA domain-containing protein [Erysipelothrix sp.]
MNITIYNEFVHELENEKVKEIYPDGMHQVIGSYFEEDAVHYATLQDHTENLSPKVLDKTDVLIWWGHLAHDKVSDEVVANVHKRVLEGMGLVVLHSGHMSKIFIKLMGTTCDLKWREADDLERLWVIEPSHPIMDGIGEYIELEHEEMYGEFFDIPTPDELLMISWFSGGEVFRSACTYKRGHGKIFYFRPGHETYPTYHHEDIKKVIQNGVKWAKPVRNFERKFGNSKPLEGK